MQHPAAPPPRGLEPEARRSRDAGRRHSECTQALRACGAEARKANQVFVDLLGAIAARKSATPAQVALGWLLAQKPWIVPIPGTTKLHRLDENVVAVELRLSPDELREIDEGAARITVEGARYSESMLRMTDG